MCVALTNKVTCYPKPLIAAVDVNVLLRTVMASPGKWLVSHLPYQLYELIKQANILNQYHLDLLQQ